MSDFERRQIPFSPPDISEAEIEEVYVCDKKGIRTNALIKGDECSIHMIVKIN